MSPEKVITARKIFIFFVAILVGYSIFADLNIYWKIAFIFIGVCLMFNLAANNKKDNDYLKGKYGKPDYDSFFRE